MEVLKIGKAEQLKATMLNIVVCWYGDVDTGFYYTCKENEDKLIGEIVEITLPENQLP